MIQASEDRLPSGRRRWAWMAGSASIALNVLLLGFLLYPGHLAGPGNPGAGSPEANSGADAFASRSVTAHRPLIPPETATPWSRLFSTNLLVFAERLRAAGCPDETVCDVLLPEIERQFERLRDQARYRGDFWMPGEERRRVGQESSRERERLDQVEDDLVDQLGCASSWSMDGADSLRTIFEMVAGGLSAEQKVQVFRLIQREERRVDRWKEQTEGVVLPEERAEFQRREEQFLARLERWISPAEQDEVSLRLWAIQNESVFQESFQHMALSGAEFREFCRIHAQGEAQPIDESVGYDDLLGKTADTVTHEQRWTELQALLGEERSRTLAESLHSMTAPTRELAIAAGADPDLASQVFSMMEPLENDIVPELQRLWTVDPDAAMQQLREHRERFREALQERLGALPEDKRPALISGWLDHAIRRGWTRP